MVHLVHGRESALNQNLIYFHIYDVKVCIEYVGLINKVIDFISTMNSFVAQPCCF